jgi:hypothetical protein
VSISDVGPCLALLRGRLLHTLMMTFFEYLSRTQAAWLQPPEKILARLGIDVRGPHPIDVMRLVKQMKQADAQAPARAASGVASARRSPGASRPSRHAGG